ncbi:Asp23/Gls24 family envelope stress response protein [Streptomyces albus subsp. chlorinus]|uniref:Asp23/Gls24 family envelope stress response protein n=1 Tax=Streptomyces albus TaxID=1888 RepID=UPI003D100F65
MTGGQLPGDERVRAGGRGATRIADRVVAKVAAQAAREALRGYRHGGSGAGGADSGTGPGPDAARQRPAAGPGPLVRQPVRRTAVSVRERTARVRMTLELHYPSDLGAQCGAVRRRVASRVKELVGMDVPDVALDIERLRSAHLRGDSAGRVT